MKLSARGIVLLPVLLALIGCDSPSSEEPVQPRPVLTVKTKEQPAQARRFAGVVEPQITADHGFRVLGRIAVRSVNTGELVTAGTIVATIDPLALQLTVRSAQADLANSQAELVNATATVERSRRLVASRFASQATLEVDDQAFQSAKAAVDGARANLARAEEQLSYAELRAEFDGVVTATAAEVGQVVSAGQTVLTLARPDLRDAVIDVPDDQLAGLEIGSIFDVVLQADTRVTASGRVREIGPQADSATRTRRLKIALEHPPEAFRLGSTVSAIARNATGSVITLPATAVLEQDGSFSVWVMNPQSRTVSLRTLETMPFGIDDPIVTILAGLQPGEDVVVAGVHHLEEGQLVRTNEEQAR